MPIYEYQCGSCGYVFDTLQRISDEPLTECPSCGEPALKKLVSASAFRLKGKGWYETDFKTGNKKNVAQGDKKPGAGAASKQSDSAASKQSDSTSSKKSGSTASKKSGGSG